MKQKIHPIFIDALHTQVYISRFIKVFGTKDIATNWGVSKRTLLRYESPEDRNLSRVVARRANKIESTRDKSFCQLCPKKLAKHPRCTVCTMLIHGTPECECIALTQLYLDNGYITKL